jgi:hypothetical protein
LTKSSSYTTPPKNNPTDESLFHILSVGVVKNKLALFYQVVKMNEYIALKQ